MDRRVVRPRLIRCHCGQVNEARAEWCIRCLKDFEPEQRRKERAEVRTPVHAHAYGRS